MKRFLKWILISLIILVFIGGTAYAYFAYTSHNIMHQKFEVSVEQIDIPSGADAIAEGERLARIRGCMDGCHGKDMQGQVFIDNPLMAKVIAPNLTRFAANHSDAELIKVIRYGVRTDGTSVWIMPSQMFFHLNDEELGAIIAFIRSVPVTDGPDWEFSLGPLAMFAVSTGEFKAQASEVARQQTRFEVTDPGDPLQQGKYLALTVCTECHGQDLQGVTMGEFSTPDLRVVHGYTLDEFVTLMRNGKPIGERELKLMAQVARSRFSHFTDSEIAHLHTYLQSL